jgi:hypothetical protein
LSRNDHRTPGTSDVPLDAPRSREFPRERAAADHALGATACAISQLAVRGDEPERLVQFREPRSLAGQPVVGALTAGAHDPGSFRGSAVEDDDSPVAEISRPLLSKLDELVVRDVRPLRPLHVPCVDQDRCGYDVAHAMSSVEQATEDVAESRWTKGLARAGLVAKGITFGIVASLALKVALGAGGNLEDRPAALHTVAKSGFGRVLLAALAIGLAGYALWRFAQALLGRKLETGEREGVLKRIGFAARGALYAWLAFLCAELVVDAHKSTGGGNNEDKATARVLDLPLGGWLVAAAGLFVIGAGLFNVYRGLSRKFRKDLKEQQMGSKERRWYSVIGVIGHEARGAVFLLAGVFLVRAAWQYDPEEAVGLDGALAKLAHAQYGDLLLGLTAAGLFAYGLFCLIQARYREV